MLASLRSRARTVQSRYAGDEPRPLPGYVLLTTGYTAVTAALLAAARRKAGASTAGLEWGDLALTAVATYRLSRVLTKSAVTSPLRAPFTQFEGPGMPGEVNEQVADDIEGRPVAHAAAELLTCPFCMGQWIATGLVAGHVLAPGATRLVTAMMTAAAGAEALHFGHAALQRLDPDEH
ncbi:MAG TPA: DUF1360 domain-containing protein [Dermatophilaceae bacterium]|nr:DUF1360 domain-containing protein [Dermatophilaceae bacterium]